MNIDMTLLVLLTISTVLALANVHSRNRDEEETDNDVEEVEENEEEEEDNNGRNVLDQLDFIVPGRSSMARLLYPLTSKKQDGVIGDASAARARSSYTSRDVKIHNLYLWMLLDGSDPGLRSSLRTKKDQVKDQLREDKHLKDHTKDHLVDRMPVRDTRRRKLAGLFKGNYLYVALPNSTILFSRGGDLGGTGGRSPKKFEVEGRPMHWSPNILRSSV